MARGWESKSVEEQISARENKAAKPGSPRETPEQSQKRIRKEGLMLVRTRTLTALQMACDGRYRAQLQTALADLDRQLAELG